MNQERLAATKDELKRTRDERDRARRLSAHLIAHGKLKDILRAHTDAYRSAEPFPHVVIDDLFDPRLLKDVVAEFDAMDRTPWHHTERATERKYSTEDFQRFGPTTRAVMSQLNAAPFMAFLEKLTGIAGLIPDPHLRGGGLHEIRRGGALGVHADFNFYKRLNLFRRLNLLIYLNENWVRGVGRPPGALGPDGKEVRAAHRADLQPRGNLRYLELQLSRSSPSAGVPARAVAEVAGALLLHRRGARGRRPHTSHDAVHPDRRDACVRTGIRRRPLPGDSWLRWPTRSAAGQSASIDRARTRAGLPAYFRMLYTMQRLYASSGPPGDVTQRGG